MKNLLFCLFFLPFVTIAQDTVALKMQGAFAAQILDVDTLVIRYKKFANPFGPTYTAQKSSVSYIRYEKGEKINIDSLYKHEQLSSKEEELIVQTSQVLNSPSLYLKGDQDARIHYNRRCGAVGTGITAFLFGGIGGLIPAIICSCVPPQTKNLGYPNEQLWSDASYKSGYKKRARKIKLRKVWTGFGIGVAGAAVFGLFILNQ